jgi:hypothetical protein
MLKGIWYTILLNIDEIKESQFPFVCEDFKAWFKTVHIDFPYAMDEFLEIHDSSDDSFSLRG